jgi:murein DD-endopeptidase MepM/ murein hydrolase activator NlpD
MGKLKNKYNIMIFSTSNGKSINLEVSSYLIKTILFFIVFLVVISLFSTYHYIKYGSNKKELVVLKEKNNILSKKIQNFNQEINQLKEKVDKLNNLGTKLRVMARLDIPENKVEGVGGPSFDDVKNFVNEKSFEDQNIKNLHYVLDKLNFELKQEENNIKQLYKYYKENNIKLSSTPSIWPSKGWVSSPFGWRRDPFTGRRRFHEGLDITNRCGTPVVAPADGIVVFAGRHGGYGNVIYISHGFGISTRYGHLHKITVKVGQHVQRGDIIGEIGSTGRSTGPHLHYEVRVNNKPVNPINFILD